eukprot:gene30966-37428_t
MLPTASGKEISVIATTLVENFEAFEGVRLKLPLTLEKKFPPIEDIVAIHKSSNNIERIQEADASGNSSHPEIVEIREAIAEEATTVLSQLKSLEWKRTNTTINKNCRSMLSMVKLQKERADKLSETLITGSAIPKLNYASQIKASSADVKAVASKTVKISLSKDSLDVLPSLLPKNHSVNSSGTSATASILQGSFRRIPMHPPLPRSFCWVPLSKNVIVDDEEVLRAVPWFGDEDNDGFDVSHFNQQEYATRDKGHFKEFNLIKASEVNSHLSLQCLGGKDVVFDPDSEENVKNGLGAGLGIRNTKNKDHILEVYRDFFCRRCYTYGCDHGVEHVQPRQTPSFPPPFTFPVQPYCLPIEALRAHRRSSAENGVMGKKSDLMVIAKKIGGKKIDPTVESFGQNNAFYSSKASNSSHDMAVGEVSTDFSIFDMLDTTFIRQEDQSDPFFRHLTTGLELPPPNSVVSSASAGKKALDRDQDGILSRKNTLAGPTVSSAPKKPIVIARSFETSYGIDRSQAAAPVKRKIPLYHQLYEDDVLPLPSKMFRSTDIPLADCEEALIEHLAALHNDLQLPPGWLGEVFADVKGDNALGRADFVATMLGTRSVEDVRTVLDVLDQEKIDQPAIVVTQNISMDIDYEEEEIGSEIDGSVMSSNFSSLGANAKAPRRKPKNTFRLPYEASSRVCDPDLCNTCGSYIPPDMRDAVEKCCTSISNIADSFTLCQNIGFTDRIAKKLLIQPSKIHGWGLHAAESIRKHDYIIEYVGEVISQEEAERRGLVYDKLDLSFLFKLNNMQCIDATRRGNKAKYINHSEQHANCVPKIVQVGGDHKVILLALRDIKVGEELFFNYLYEKTAKHTAPDWSKGKKATSKALKKTVKEE